MFWGVEIFAGSYDPRPSPPVRNFEVGSIKNQFQARFKPSVPVGSNSASSNLEYNVFLLANQGVRQSESFVPSTSCGYMTGGFQLKQQWTRFGEYETMYTLESDLSYIDYVEGSGVDDFYITVIARQIDNGASRTYNAQ